MGHLSSKINAERSPNLDGNKNLRNDSISRFFMTNQVGVASLNKQILRADQTQRSIPRKFSIVQNIF